MGDTCKPQCSMMPPQVSSLTHLNAAAPLVAPGGAACWQATVHGLGGTAACRLVHLCSCAHTLSHCLTCSCASALQIIVKVAIQGERPRMDADCPDGLQRLISRCWHQDPHYRPSCAEIMRLTEILMQQVSGRVMYVRRDHSVCNMSACLPSSQWPSLHHVYKHHLPLCNLAAQS